MLNALTVDVEDYFQVEAFASVVSRDHWDRYPLRVERNVDRILELFSRNGVRATFFVLGWVAERLPHLVRRIAEAGHEIGSHGLSHRRVDVQQPAEFRAELRQARERLEEQIQRPVRCYRAPSFSIIRSTLWAFEALVEEGFQIDSSVFPVRHDIYGIPDAPRFPHWRPTAGGGRVFEFPPSTICWGGQNWGVGGGGYLRFAPYRLTRWALARINQVEAQPAMVYFHPWELDPEQPRIAAPWRSRVRHYTNLRSMEQKVTRLLRDFRFAGLSEVCRTVREFQAAA
jgi:polysaccharide deacetylase family protein (PEP-CTERM system associated)